MILPKFAQKLAGMSVGGREFVNICLVSERTKRVANRSSSSTTLWWTTLSSSEVTRDQFSRRGESGDRAISDCVYNVDEQIGR